MGILNLTPDSFFDGGRFNNIDKSMLKINQMISDGADIIDIGAVSTRPGSTPISYAEEKKDSYQQLNLSENYILTLYYPLTHFVFKLLRVY